MVLFKWGYYLGKELFAERGGLGCHAKVYNVELMGIAKAMKSATEFADRHEQVKHIHIYADNTAAVTSAYEPKLKLGQL